MPSLQPEPRLWPAGKRAMQVVGEHAKPSPFPPSAAASPQSQKGWGALT